jgi:predicted permease
MAAGIGLSVYQFSFLNTLAYKAIPFKDGDSLVVINQMRDNLVTGPWLKLYDFEQIRSNIRGLKEITIYKDKNINISGRDNAKQYSGTYAEPNIFDLSRTKPLLGRAFTNEENRVGAENVIVIGFELWQNIMGGDPDIIDQTIRVNGSETRIIGVMPEGYAFPINSQAWLPMRQDATKITRENSPDVGGLAHLEEGASITNVNSQLKTIMAKIADLYPESHNGISAFASTIPKLSLHNGAEAFVIAMYVVAALLLLLASINVGNLLLARAVERSKETAIRVALGAPRMRIINQMLSESIIICTLGGVIGLLLATWALEGTTEVIAEMNGGTPIYWMRFGLDSFTLAIFFGFLFGTIVVTGFLPAWKNSGANFNAVLRDGTRGALGKKAGRLNGILVTSEVFLSMAVLIIASVIVTGTYKMTHAEYGVDTLKKLTGRIQLSEEKYSPEQVSTFAKNLQTSLNQANNITNATIASALPGQFTWAPLVAIDGKEYTDDSALPRVNYVAVMPGFFESLDIKLLEGRLFDSSDQGLEKRTVIITQSMADLHFPNQEAVGQRLRIAEIDSDIPQWLTIVGVVQHTVYALAGFPGTEVGTIFRPITQAPRHGMVLSVNMQTPEVLTTKTIRDTLAAIDPDLALFDIVTYENFIKRNSTGIIFMSRIFLFFALVALGLAATGIYGVMSNTILQRTQETGVKRALGATEAAITKAFLLQGFKQLLWGAIPGILVGTAVGFAITQMMSIDNVLLGLLCIFVTAVIGAIVLLATYLPTQQALNMEPSQALRHE